VERPAKRRDCNEREMNSRTASPGKGMHRTAVSLTGTRLLTTAEYATLPDGYLLLWLLWQS
jgi:hypothetical protein